VTPSAGDKDAELAALHKENAELRRGQRDSEASGEFLRGGARPPTQEIVEFIDANREEFGVEPICAVLSEHGMPIAPSTYYAAKARGPVSDAMWAEAHAAHAAHTLFWANRASTGSARCGMR
jgi:hypothetical protein